MLSCATYPIFYLLYHYHQYLPMRKAPGIDSPWTFPHIGGCCTMGKGDVSTGRDMEFVLRRCGRCLDNIPSSENRDIIRMSIHSDCGGWTTLFWEPNRATGVQPSRLAL
jgi:hypothetical protein